MKTKTIALLIVLGFFPLSPIMAAICDYDTIDLGTLGGAESRALGINDEGLVVGVSQTPTGQSQPFFWDRHKGMIDIGLEGCPNGIRALNNAGQVVGGTSLGSGGPRAFVWDRINGLKDLGTLGGWQSEACDINDHGRVVGWSETGEDVTHAFVWDPASGLTDLGLLNSQNSIAEAINNSGVIVGAAQSDNGHWRAFIRDPDHKMTYLPSQGGLGSHAVDINENGSIVGQWLNRSLRMQGFMYREDQWRVLSSPNDSWTEAFRINARGQILALSGLLDGPFNPLLWTPKDGAINLNTLLPEDSHWRQLTRIEDINKHGQIVGTGYTRQGQLHAFLMDPAPEPSTIILLALGGIALLRKRR